MRDLSLQLPENAVTVMLGLNGTGKTLTLHTLAGLRAVDSGSVLLDGQPLQQFSRADVARRLGLLLQSYKDAFPVTVLEMVLMGCYARLGMWRWESNDDIEAARQALDEFGLLEMESRIVTSLSGGERRRVALAAMRVQNPDIWLLDEPSNHLDPHHQLELMARIEAMRANGKTVLTSLHDPLLAARHADYALFLHGDGSWEFGAASELLTPERISELYGLTYERLQGQERAALVPT